MCVCVSFPLLVCFFLFPFVQGEWKPRQIDNPAYKGEWVHPQIANPEYSADDKLYQYSDIGAIGFDLWQVILQPLANGQLAMIAYRFDFGFCRFDCSCEHCTEKYTMTQCLALLHSTSNLACKILLIWFWWEHLSPRTLKISLFSPKAYQS